MVEENTAISQIHRRIFLIVHNPLIHAEGGRPLSAVFGWNDPGELVQEFIAEIKHCSYGIANFELVDRLDVDAFPIKADGFQYTEETYVSSWRSRQGFHRPDLVDYPRLVDEFDMLPKIRREEIDEIWLFAFPYGGYYESIMAGPGAFWCNSPPLPKTAASGRRFVIMGFNYERGVGEMMESFGHRAESILRQVFADQPAAANLWDRFIQHDKTHPGGSEVGTIHFAPNSARDYDWGNFREVPSRCDAWYSFPQLAGEPRAVNCREWGNGDIRAHHRWWFRHLPHFPGAADGISYNWWEYILDPNRVE